MKALIKNVPFALMATALFSCGDKNGGGSGGETPTPANQTFIQIPDPGLKEVLLRAVDTDNDGNISKEEVNKTLSFTQFHINASGKNIKDLTGIENFTSITELNLSNNQLTNVDKLKALTKLKELNLTGNNLSGALDLSSLQSLLTPDIVKAPNNTGVTAIRVASFQKANEFNLKEETTKYTNDVPGQSINFVDVAFKSWILSQGRTIDRDGNGQITPEEARAFTGNMPLGSVNVASLDDLRHFQNIKSFSVTSTSLTSLNLSGLTQLESLQVSNALTSVNLSNLPNLKSLDLRNNRFSELTLTGLPALTSLHLANNRTLSQLNIKALTSLQELNLLEIGVSGVLDLRTLTNLISDKVNILASGRNPSITAVQVATIALMNSLNGREGTNLYTTEANVDTSTVTIANAEFRKVIQTALETILGPEVRNRSSFTKTELARIKNISLRQNIESILGLEHLTGLEVLDMGASISNYTLPNLPNLKRLNISGNIVTSVDLNNITTLTDFGITAPNITNIDLTRNHNLQKVIIGSSSNAMPRLQCVKVLQSQVEPLKNLITGFEATAKKEKIKSVCN